MSIGSLNEAIVHPREVFRPLIAVAAFAFVLVHNHPSGVPDPSKADKILTRRLQGAADLMAIRFLDHVITGENCYYSFSEDGLL